MTEEGLVERLWRDGPAPGQGPALVRLAQQHRSLAVFAGLGQLADDREFVGPEADSEAADAPTRALLGVLDRWQRLDPAEARLVVEGDDPRWVAVTAWSGLVRSLGQLAGGRRSTARHRLLRLLSDSTAPARVCVLAGWAAARPETHASSDAPVRTQALVQAARIARRAGWEEHADFADLAAALLDVEHRRIARGYERLQGLLDGAFGENPLGVAVRSSMALELPFPQANELLRHGLVSAAGRGDDWAYATIVKAAAGMYLLAGDDASAVLVLTTGMKQLERGGSARAAELRKERAGLSKLLGEVAYAAACERARALLAADHARLVAAEAGQLSSPDRPPG